MARRQGFLAVKTSYLTKLAGAAIVAALMALYLEGRIKPAISERFPLQRAGEAIGRLATREVRGKVVVMIE